MIHLIFVLGLTAAAAAAAGFNIVGRTKKNRFNRRQLSHGQLPTPGTIPATITSVGTTQAQVVFAGVIVVASTPAYQVNGVAPTSVTNPTPGTFLLNYAATIATHTIVIPSNDPAIRTAQGGYVTAQSKTF
jgi:hypothetical protein